MSDSTGSEFLIGFPKILGLIDGVED